MRPIFLFLIIFFSCSVFGQVSEVEDSYIEEEYEITRVHFVEGNFSMYAPLDAFSEKIDKTLLYGFSLGYLVQLQKGKPSFIGIEAFHMNLGLYSKSYDDVIGTDPIELTGKVASNGLGINLNYRYYPPFKIGRIESYLEGHLGMKWLYSYLSETGAFLDDEPYSNFDFLDGDWVLTYGGAFGMQIHISDFYYLNFKSTYHFAVSGEYQRRLTDNLGIIDFPQEAFETVQSSTNFVKIDIGMTFLF